MLNVALVSISRGPSLALRNLCTYAGADKNLANKVRFYLLEYKLERFYPSRYADHYAFNSAYDQVLKDLQKVSPRIIGLSCYVWNLEYVLTLAKDIKQILPDACLVLGGPNAGPLATELLNEHPYLDIIVKADGEIPFTALLKQFAGKIEPDLSAIEGIVFRNGSGITENPPCSKVVDVNRMAGVYNDLPENFSLRKWSHPMVLYETQRGCPYACSFCTWGSRKIIQKDIDLVVKDLLFLLKKGFAVWIVDPTFTAQKNRSKKILERLSEHNYSGMLNIEAHHNSLDEEFVRLFGQTNVFEISLGLQTISKKGSHACKRSNELEKFRRSVKLLQQYNAKFRVDIIYGLPRTAPEDFLATVDFVYSLGVRTVLFYRLLGLPGAALLNDAHQYGMTFSQSPPYELLSSDSYSLEDLMFCCDFAHMYNQLMNRVGPHGLNRFVKPTDSISQFVKKLMAFDKNSHSARSGQAPFRRHRSSSIDEQVQPNDKFNLSASMNRSLIGESKYAPN